MKLRLHQRGAVRVAEVVADGVVLSTVQDALDLMVAAGEQEARGLVLHAAQLAPAFFELRTGLAGEILQKFVNYRVELAIVGDLARYPGRALQAFILECNRGGPLSFAPDLERALARLYGQVA
jgi:hypothetical protein